jgi:hypothetical protein
MEAHNLEWIDELKLKNSEHVTEMEGETSRDNSINFIIESNELQVEIIPRVVFEAKTKDTPNQDVHPRISWNGSF